MPRKPLLTILITGLIGFLLSGSLTYQWAHRSPGERTAASPSSTDTPASSDTPATASSGGDTPSGAELGPDDWEAFLDYEGERRVMLGIKRDYSIVNFRNGPSTDYRILETPPGGTLLKRLDRYNGWYRARLPGGTVGWIHGSLVRILRVPEPVFRRINAELPPLEQTVHNQTPADFANHSRLEVTGSVVNLRQGRGTQYKIIGRLYRYEILRMLAKSGNWYRVKHRGGVTGWVHESLVRRTPRDQPPEPSRVTVNGATLRIGPRGQMGGDRTLGDSGVVDVLDREGSWVQIAVGEDHIGWVHDREVSPAPPDRTG